jgi:hypothetical protein
MFNLILYPLRFRRTCFYEGLAHFEVLLYLMSLFLMNIFGIILHPNFMLWGQQKNYPKLVLILDTNFEILTAEDI